MPKQKKKPLNNKTLPFNKPKNQPTLPFQAPLAPPTQPQPGLKRKIADLSHFIKKQESVSPPTVEKKYFIQHFLKQRSFSIEILAQQCPHFQSAIHKIQAITRAQKSLIYSTIQSFLQGNKLQLWSEKYAPKNLKQCLHKNVGQKIMRWIRIYLNYRNCCPEESNSLLDYFGDGSSNSEYKFLRENGWKLKGLILKGRSGVGKSTSIRVTAKQLECEIFHCGNECNQIKYLRERNEATQSECVKMKINKNQAQIQRTNKTLTSFATRSDENEMQQQSKRIQFMHNIGNFYPRQDETKFFNELNKTVESSKIPFLMTLTGENVPESLNGYDIIDFEEGKREEIARMLFLIFHIEKSFGRCLDLEKPIERERFKWELNEQLKNFEVEVESGLEEFLRMVEVGNGRLDFLLCFVENAYRFGREPRVEEAEREMKEYLRRADESILMREYFYSSNPLRLQRDESEELVDAKYLVWEKDEKVENKDVLESTSSGTKKRGGRGENEIGQVKSQVQKNENKQKEQSQEEVKLFGGQSLSEIIKELDMRVLHDYCPRVLSDDTLLFNKLYNPQSHNQVQEELSQNIGIKEHMAIRKKMVRDVKREYNVQTELSTSIKEKELNYVGFLIDTRYRVSRKKVNNLQQLNLRKYLKNNQVNYLQAFTQILKPNSAQLQKP